MRLSPQDELEKNQGRELDNWMFFGGSQPKLAIFGDIKPISKTVIMEDFASHVTYPPAEIDQPECEPDPVEFDE